MIDIMNVSTSTTSMGVTTLATQMPTVGTMGGIGAFILVLAVCIQLAHEINIKGTWLYRFWKWLSETAFFKALVGLWTCLVVGSVWFIGDWIASGDGTAFAWTVVQGAFYVVLAFAGLVVVGYLTEPLWVFICYYVFGEETTKPRKNEASG